MTSTFECPNCGAPVMHNASGECPFCHTVLVAPTSTGMFFGPTIVPNEAIGNAPAALQSVLSLFNDISGGEFWAGLRAAGHAVALDQLVPTMISAAARVMAIPAYAKIERTDALDLRSQVCDFLTDIELWATKLTCDIGAAASKQDPGDLFLKGEMEMSAPLITRLGQHHERKVIAGAHAPTTELASLRAAVPDAAQPT